MIKPITEAPRSQLYGDGRRSMDHGAVTARRKGIHQADAVEKFAQALRENKQQQEAKR